MEGATTARGQDTRRRLLDAAASELLSRRGDVELADVARRAQVSPGAPYRHFKSKGDLLRTLVNDFYDRFDAEIFKIGLEPLGDWRTRELERTRRFVAFFYREPIAPVLLSFLSGEAEVVAAQAARIERAKAAAAKNVRRGMSEGAIPATIDPVIAGAAVIGGFLHGVGAGLTASPPLSRARVERALCRFLVAALELAPPRKRGRRT
jgi:AcrR family transcriptional regulator